MPSTIACAQQATSPATTPAGSSPQTVTTPAPESPDQIESRPGYRMNPADYPQPTPVQPNAAPIPQQSPAPVVTPALPTPQVPFTAMPAYAPIGTETLHTHSDQLGSTYIPVDSWVYPAMLRLYSLGYLDTMYLSLRPYTRRSALHMLQASEDAILSSDDAQAQEILSALLNELTDEGITNTAIAGSTRGAVYGLQSVYTRVTGISGNILRDSFHLGQTFFNDYGRPEEPGFNNITGFSTLNEQGRFSLYLRGEYQHAPGGPGYSFNLASQLASIDETAPIVPPNYPQATIPLGSPCTESVSPGGSNALLSHTRT